MKLIGINGRKGSGKSTLANAFKKHLYDNYQRQAIVASFAAPLKRVCYKLFGGHLDNYYGTDEQKSSPTPYWQEKLGYVLDDNGKKISSPGFGSYREIMQTIGTKLFRECLDKDFWLYVMEQHFNEAKKGFNSVFIIDDVRFDNEAQWIIDRGGFVYTVHPRRISAKKDEHISEQPLSDAIKTEDLEFSNVVEMNEYIKLVMYPFIQRSLKDVK